MSVIYYLLQCNSILLDSNKQKKYKTKSLNQTWATWVEDENSHLLDQLCSLMLHIDEKSFKQSDKR